MQDDFKKFINFANKYVDGFEKFSPEEIPAIERLTKLQSILANFLFAKGFDANMAMKDPTLCKNALWDNKIYDGDFLAREIDDVEGLETVENGVKYGQIQQFSKRLQKRMKFEPDGEVYHLFWEYASWKEKYGERRRVKNDALRFYRQNWKFCGYTPQNQKVFKMKNPLVHKIEDVPVGKELIITQGKDGVFYARTMSLEKDENDFFFERLTRFYSKDGEITDPDKLDFVKILASFRNRLAHNECRTFILDDKTFVKMFPIYHEKHQNEEPIVAVMKNDYFLPLLMLHTTKNETKIIKKIYFPNRKDKIKDPESLKEYLKKCKILSIEIEDEKSNWEQIFAFNNAFLTLDSALSGKFDEANVDEKIKEHFLNEAKIQPKISDFKTSLLEERLIEKDSGANSNFFRLDNFENQKIFLKCLIRDCYDFKIVEAEDGAYLSLTQFAKNSLLLPLFENIARFCLKMSPNISYNIWDNTALFRHEIKSLLAELCAFYFFVETKIRDKIKEIKEGKKNIGDLGELGKFKADMMDVDPKGLDLYINKNRVNVSNLKNYGDIWNAKYQILQKLGNSIHDNAMVFKFDQEPSNNLINVRFQKVKDQNPENDVIEVECKRLDGYFAFFDQKFFQKYDVESKFEKVSVSDLERIAKETCVETKKFLQSKKK